MSRFLGDFVDFFAQNALFSLPLEGIRPLAEALRPRLGRGFNRNQLSHPHQVISRRREGEYPSHVE
jgi:hypothetical protein